MEGEAMEKRSQRRFRADLPVQLLSSGGDLVIHGRTTDLSAHGLGLRLDELPEDRSSTLRLRLDAGPLRPSVELQGRIVWTNGADSAGCRLGVWVEPSSEARPAWELLLAQHLSPSPQVRKDDMIPRRALGGDAVRSTRAWLSERLQLPLEHIAKFSFDPDQAASHIENLIGATQVPLGVAGPLLVNGVEARGLFYVPLATTEGTLVQTYQHGMLAISRAGGANVQVLNDRLDITPAFVLEDQSEAVRFSGWLRDNFDRIKAAAEQTTRHGRLLELKCQVLGRRVLATFVFSTGDAMGMNIVNIATQRACDFIVEQVPVERWFLRCNASADKKPASLGLHRCYGKEVIADATIPRRILSRYYGVTPQEVAEFYYTGTLGSVQAGMLGMNAHFANGLAAVYLACGQDVAQVVNSAVGISAAEVTAEDDLYINVKLPSLTVATVGGGTQLATQSECLRMMECHGPGKVEKFAEIVAATILAGELSIFCALASGRFVEAHLRKRGVATTS
jgi:hydroxymethylglutaryl-CoA reductase (NADPH)